MQQIRMGIAALAMAALIAGCSAKPPLAEWVVIDPPPDGTGQAVTIVGTVRHLDLEGGLYVISSAEGTNYNPTNLPAIFRVDGKAVEAEGRQRDDMVSIGMVGPIVDLVRIRERPVSP